MKPKEQKALVKSLCDGVAKNLCAQIDSGKIPEDWDGLELRQLLSDSLRWRDMDRARKQKYNNTVLINNL